MSKSQKPTRPKGESNVVEIDAIAVAEWEHDQHTPQAPAAGLAALVRQTAALPVVEPRARMPTERIGSRRPPRPPPASQTIARPATPSPSPLPGAIPHSIDEPAREPARGIDFDLPVTRPAMPNPALRALAAEGSPPPIAHPAHPDSVPLPLIAPPSEPVFTPPPAAQFAPAFVQPAFVQPAFVQPASVLPAPVLPAPSAALSAALRTVADYTPTSSQETSSSGELIDGRAPPPSVRSRFGSLRMFLLVGGAATVAVIVIAFVALGASTPKAKPQAASAAAPARASSPAADTKVPAPTARAAATPSAPIASATKAPPSEPRTSRSAPAHKEPAHKEPARTPRMRLAEAPSTSRASEPASRQPARPSPTKRATARVKRPPSPETRRELVALSTDDEPAVEQARVAYATGNESLFAGDFGAAIESYRQAIAVAPSYAAGHRGLGLAYTEQGDSAAALKAFRTYLTLAPKAKDVTLIKRRIAGLQSTLR